MNKHQNDQNTPKNIQGYQNSPMITKYPWNFQIDQTSKMIEITAKKSKLAKISLDFQNTSRIFKMKK